MRSLLRQELRLLLRSRARVGVLVAYAAALAAGVGEGVRVASIQQETNDARGRVEADWRAGVTESFAEWERTGGESPPRHTHPSTAGGSATNAFLPPAPLAALGVGQTDLFPSWARVAMWMRSAEQFDAIELHNPVQLATGHFDATFVVVHLLPLLLIALAGGMLAAEREAGVLPLMLASPIPTRRILAAKVLAAALPPLVVTVGVVVIAAALVPPLRAQPLGLLVWLLLVSFYIGFWILLAAGLNAKTRSLGVASARLCVLWLIWVLLVPATLAAAIRSGHPAPSRLELSLALRAANHDAEERSEALLAAYLHSHPHAPATPSEDRNKRFVLERRAVEDELLPLLTGFDETAQAQQRAVDRWRLLSPAVALHEALHEAAGTSQRRSAAFRVQVNAFQQDWAKRYGGMVFREERLTLADWESRPEFRFGEPPFRDRALRAGTDLLVLFSMLTLAGGLAWTRAGRRLEP